MTTIVWVTGRAAVGKSTVIDACAAELGAAGSVPRVLTDEALLFRLKQDDEEHRHHYHPCGDHRFLFRDGFLFDESLRKINAELVNAVTSGSADIFLVELARGLAGSVADVSYGRGLTLIDPQLWRHSLVFRLDAPFVVQLRRSRNRGALATPEAIMRNLYADDDPESWTAAGIDVRHLPPGTPAEAATLICEALGVVKADG